MNIKPRKGVLLIRKHKKTHLKADIAVEENDEDKRLITGEVTAIWDEGGDLISVYKVGQTVIFGRYAIYQLTIAGDDYYFLNVEDVIGICDYKENV